MRAFTPEQQEAIDRRDGPLLISASAGSGKTTVLVERFVRSVLDDGLRPDEVLAITFTDKAAGELRARVRRELRARGGRDAARAAEAAWIMTFHGLCTRVLRAHAVAAGLDPAFVVLDGADARAARAEAFEAALAGLLADRDGVPRRDALDLAAAYGVDRLRDMVTAVHDELRSRGETHPGLPPPRPADLAEARAALAAARDAAAAELDGGRSLASLDAAREALGHCRDQLAAGGAVDAGAIGVGRGAAELKSDAFDAYRAACAGYQRAMADAAAAPAVVLAGELLDRFATAYAHAKRRRSGVDYDDLELLTRDLLDREPGVAAAYAARFARIMVDEFQDTNPLQMALLARLERDNACTVGDELQSIYGFRHADVRVFRARRAALERIGATTTLATSFRARPDILAALNAAFAGEHDRWEPLRAGRTDPPSGPPPIELLVTDADAWNGDAPAALGAGLPPAGAVKQAEARLVAQRVAELVRGGGFSAGDVVILMRAATDMGLYEQALRLQGLATLAAGGRGWWARQQIQDLCAYLAALANPRDDEALYGLLASPLVGASSDGLALLAMAARAARRSPWDALGDPELRVPDADAGRLAAFRAWFAEERRGAPRRGLDELLARVIERTGYDLHVLALPGGARRLANIHRLMALAADFEARRGRDLRGLVDLAASELAADAPQSDAPVDLGGLDAVRLMTIHAAKGLEFPVVVVADLGRQGNVRQADLLVDADEVGLRLVDLDANRANTLDYDAIAERRRAAEDAEERRVMHVAVTRAEERLILSGATRMGDNWPRVRPGGPPIAWMAPALVPDVAALTLEDAVRERGAVRALLNAPGAGALRLEAPAVEPGAQRALALHEEPPARAAAPAARRLAPADARPAPPGALSYSGLAKYAACAYRYHLERGLGLPEVEPPAHLVDAPAPAPSLDARLRGTLVHELLERLDLAPGAPLPGPPAVRALAERHEAELSDADVSDLLTMVRAFAASALHARLQRAAAVHREAGFAFALASGPLVHGFLDVLAVEDGPGGGALVVDYKSDRLGDADPEALVAASYGAQRRIYALAALRAGHPSAEVAHVFLERPDEPAVARYRAADAPALEAELQADAAPLLAGDFPVARHPHRGLCATCPGRGTLCSHPSELTDRELADAV
ncbi:MAG: UvrD-helicase domain-containing protein [Solirubrobacteraceae bacterium]